MTSPTPAAADEVLKSPPFVTIDGLVNFRDVGNSYGASSSTTSPGQAQLFVKPSYLYRCAEPSHITEKGKEQLKDLGVKKVFDFRSDTEIQKYKMPPMSVDRVEVVRCPVSEHENYDPISLAKKCVPCVVSFLMLDLRVLPLMFISSWALNIDWRSLTMFSPQRCIEYRRSARTLYRFVIHANGGHVNSEPTKMRLS